MFGNFGGHFGDFGCPDPHLDPKRAQGPTKTRFYIFLDEKVAPFGGLLGHLFSSFFCSSLRDTKKGGLGAPSKLVPFFGPFWDLPGGPQEGSRLHGSSIFTLQPGPKRAPKWEPKWSLLGSQIRTILTLGHHL